MYYLGYQGMKVQPLTLTSLPDVLFSGKNQTIVEYSVVWLYCLADPKSPTLEVTWNKDGEPLVQDVPHIHLRSSGSDADMYSTLILVVDKFQASDSGAYQCIAQDGDIVATGGTSRLLGIHMMSHTYTCIIYNYNYVNVT